MEDLAELAAVDDLFGERNGGHAAVVVPHGVGHAGLLDGIDHRCAFLGGTGERLFAENHLAGFGGGDGHLGMLIVGGANIDRVNIVALDQLAPIGFVTFKAPLVGECLGAVFGAAAYGLEHGRVAEVREKVADALVTIGVRAAHKAVAHEPDVEGFLFAHR